jgi:ComF family protein
VFAATRYRFPVDGLIQSCKYGGRLSTIRALSEMLRRCKPPQADLIVPMPLSPQRLRERGFNQALELARAVAPSIAAPVDAALCVKIRETSPQTRLPWQERRKNIRGAFVVLGNVTDRHVLVIDDVLTTGATLNELARGLKRAGAASVTGWVVARTVATGGSAA